MNYKQDYKAYKKPRFSPPPYLFGVVWPILYILIAISCVLVFYPIAKGDISWRLGVPFIINLVANGLFTYFQFKLKDYYLALVDIIVVLFTIIISMVLIWPYNPIVVYLQLPYLIWVSFATYLEISIVKLNKK